MRCGEPAFRRRADARVTRLGAAVRALNRECRVPAGEPASAADVVDAGHWSPPIAARWMRAA